MGIRAEEKADYEVAKLGLEAGLTGVRKALAVLQEYYGAASASMLQDEQPAKPAGHEKSSGAGGSIVDSSTRRCFTARRSPCSSTPRTIRAVRSCWSRGYHLGRAGETSRTRLV